MPCVDLHRCEEKLDMHPTNSSATVLQPWEGNAGTASPRMSPSMDWGQGGTVGTVPAARGEAAPCAALGMLLHPPDS